MSGFIDSVVSMQPPFNMIVLIVLIGSVAGIVASVAREIRRYACHREEVELKREMLDRGLDAQEIEQVVRAHAPVSGHDKRT